MKPKGKPGLLVAMAFGKGRKGPGPVSHDEPDGDEPPDDASAGADYSKTESDYDGDEEGGSAHEAAFDSLANAIGIPPEKRASANSALKMYIKECLREYGPGHEE